MLAWQTVYVVWSNKLGIEKSKLAKTVMFRPEFGRYLVRMSIRPKIIPTVTNLNVPRSLKADTRIVLCFKPKPLPAPFSVHNNSTLHTLLQRQRRYLDHKKQGHDLSAHNLMLCC
jgi:hypothetical protein